MERIRDEDITPGHYWVVQRMYDGDVGHLRIAKVMEKKGEQHCLLDGEGTYWVPFDSLLRKKTSENDDKGPRRKFVFIERIEPPEVPEDAT